MATRHNTVFAFLFVAVCFVVPMRSIANGLVTHDTLKPVDAMSIALKSCIEHREYSLPIDTLETSDTVKPHSPRRAAFYSAVLPGLGQVYNKQYWKVPLMYAGGAVAGYLIYYNYGVYNNLRKSFRYRLDGDSTTSLEQFSIWTISGGLDVNLENFSNGELLTLQQTYRRDLDLSVLLAVGVYALNVVDAVVFAHLYDFDVSDDLTLRMKPGFETIGATGFAKPSLQVGLTYRF
jgi:hypothetical protein